MFVKISRYPEKRSQLGLILKKKRIKRKCDYFSKFINLIRNTVILMLTITLMEVFMTQ